MSRDTFDHSDAKYAIPGFEHAPPSVLEKCGGFNPEYFRNRYGLILHLDPALDAEALTQVYLANVARGMVNPHPYFNEARYRGLNPDVDMAVRAGAFVSGYHQWLLVGCHEDRKGRADPQGAAGAEAVEFAAAQASAQAEARAAAAATAAAEEAAARLSAELSAETPASEAPAEMPEEAGEALMPSAEDTRLADLLRKSGVINLRWYLRRHPDLAEAGVDPILHYVVTGHFEDRAVHPFFDRAHYVSLAPAAGEPGTIALIHYIQFGSRQGISPHPAFNPAEYCATHGINPIVTNPLAHYWAADAAQTISTDSFDPEFYLAENPDLRAAGIAPLDHFLNSGVYEGRRPSPHFDTRFYYRTHLGDDYSQNAFLHWLQIGKARGLQTEPSPAGAPTVTREIARFSMPGPAFESLDTSILEGKRKRARVFAFYLPQFHAFPENDAWWGEGFTEWRNIPRGAPRFVGHYQPRIPRDLGYYTLDDPNTLRRQADLARAMGVTGFGFYFYWFNGKRLMEKPIDRFLADPSIDLPFYLIWANENWTRRWDGMESEVLISQDCRPEDDEALIDCFQRHFADQRYFTIDGRPFLVIYRPNAIPDCAATLTRWRELFWKRHKVKPLIFMAQSFGHEDPTEWGFDGAMEFPPHKVVANVASHRDKVEILDWDYRGLIVDYDDVVKASLKEAPPSYPLIKTVYPSWDNNARRPTAGQITANCTPSKYAAWLEGAIEFAEANPTFGQPIVMVNAWNEWAEGAYLEPDIHFGSAFLNATARAVTSEERRFKGDKFKVILVGHDAHPHGAQINLLHKAKMLRQRFGCELRIVLLGDGPMVAEYEDVAPTFVTTAAGSVTIFAQLAEQGFRRAILNTTVTGIVAPVLKDFGVTVTSLVHELPRLLEDYNLQAHARAIAAHADHIVFAADTVRKGFQEFAGALAGKTHIMPQGAYQTFERSADVRKRVRAELGIAPGVTVVLNAGFGDLRKGVDKFCAIAAEMKAIRKDVAFLWAGHLHIDIKRWIADEMAGADGAPPVRFLGHRDDISDLMNAADIFLLTSREDPFPSVVLEATQAGLPVIAFKGAGGIDDLIAAHPVVGRLVDGRDTKAVVTAIQALILPDRSLGEFDAERRVKLIRTTFNYAEYVFALLRLSDPRLLKLSAVVLSYNYDRYIGSRLQSVLDQTYPIFETIVIDDASKDDSRSVIDRVIATSRREVTKLYSATNSGSVYAQWARAAEIASGELLWIAEADDLAAQTLVERVAALHEGADMAFAFCDSRAIDENGWQIMDSYKPYAAVESKDLLQKDEVFDALDFARRVIATKNLILNGSAVIWNLQAFRAALSAVSATLKGYRLAGDWLLYAQACRAPGVRVGYVSDPLNVHRRHQVSVTGSIDAAAHLSEIKNAQAFVRSGAFLDGPALKRQSEYLVEVYAHLKQSEKPN